MPPPVDQLTRPRRPRGKGEAQAVGWVGRVGLAARGALYLVIAILAVQIAVGGSSRPADRSGAMQAAASHPFGRVLVALLAVGFVGFGAWEGFRAVTRGARAVRRPASGPHTRGGPE